MPEIFTVKYETFRADVLTERLDRLPLRNIKRLFELTAESCTPVPPLDADLDAQIEKAEIAWASASLEFQNGYRSTYSHDRSERAQIMRRENTRLLRRVKQTKAAYVRWIKIKNVYKEINHE